jgi:hypothetical protein
MLSTYIAHLIVLDLINPMMLAENYEVLGFSLSNFVLISVSYSRILRKIQIFTAVPFCEVPYTIIPEV